MIGKVLAGLLAVAGLFLVYQLFAGKRGSAMAATAPDGTWPSDFSSPGVGSGSGGTTQIGVAGKRISLGLPKPTAIWVPGRTRTGAGAF